MRYPLSSDKILSENLKIILLSDANSIHTQRWVESLSLRNIEIQLFSFFKPQKELLKQYNELSVKVISPDLITKIKKLREPNISKLKYLKSFHLLKKTITDFKPDILHAHYASSYGSLAFLSRFKPFILSVWGSDVSYFPNKNFMNKLILKKVINYSNVMCSTSQDMKKIVEEQFRRYDVEIVPFGINPRKFIPSNSNKSKIFTIGTIKSIESHNGIGCLIDAANIVLNDYKIEVNFLIVGTGSLEQEMRKKVIELHLEKRIKFTGFVNHKDIVKLYNDLSIFIAVSTRESFGVSVLEAAACEVPSITSDIGGLPEVNVNNLTGLVIPPNNPKKLAKSVFKLYNDEKLRLKLGKNARKNVKERFDWEYSVDKMVSIYSNQINRK